MGSDDLRVDEYWYRQCTTQEQMKLERPCRIVGTISERVNFDIIGLRVLPYIDNYSVKGTMPERYLSESEILKARHVSHPKLHSLISHWQQQGGVHNMVDGDA